MYPFHVMMSGNSILRTKYAVCPEFLFELPVSLTVSRVCLQRHVADEKKALGPEQSMYLTDSEFLAFIGGYARQDGYQETQIKGALVKSGCYAVKSAKINAAVHLFSPPHHFRRDVDPGNIAVSSVSQCGTRPTIAASVIQYSCGQWKCVTEEGQGDWMAEGFLKGYPIPICCLNVRWLISFQPTKNPAAGCPLTIIDSSVIA